MVPAGVVAMGIKAYTHLRSIGEVERAARGARSCGAEWEEARVTPERLLGQLPGWWMVTPLPERIPAVGVKDEWCRWHPSLAWAAGGVGRS